MWLQQHSLIFSKILVRVDFERVKRLKHHIHYAVALVGLEV